MHCPSLFRRSVAAVTLAAILAQPIVPAVLAAPAAAPVTPLEVKMQKSFTAMEALKREMPRDTFDPQAVLEAVGTDPAALTAWIKTNTHFVPYDGTLRGPAGVLMDRTGNSLDRSLLLANLLKSAGFEVRLAQGKLTDEQAKALAAESATPAPVATTAATDESALRKYAERFGLDPEALVKAVRGSRMESDRLAEDAANRIRSQSPALASAVGKLEAAPAAVITTHWWVQAKDGEQWTDFDPSAEAGKVLTKADTTIAADALPATQKHSVSVKVVIEQWEAGKLNEKTALEHTFLPAELAGEELSLVHTPLKWPSKADVANADEPNKVVVEQLGKQTEWLPILMLGEQQITKSSFTTTGTINDNPKADPTGSLAGAAGGAFGGLMGGGGETGGDSSVLTAEFIDYTITVPGRPTQTVRRQVFDLIGPAARAAGVTKKPGGADEDRRLLTGLNLTGTVDMLILGNRLSPQFVEMKLLSHVLADRKKIETLTKEGLKLTDAQKNAVQPGPTAGSDLYTLSLGRDLWSPVAAQTYVAEPNVLTYHVQLSQAADKTITACEGYDIVANQLAVRPGTDAAQVRVQQGVVDTTAEAMLLGSCGKVHNTSELFSTSSKGLTVLAPGGDGPSTLSADARERIKADLAAGYTVVLPDNLPADKPAAWYRIDPKTGTTLGIGQSGWGQSSTETALHNARFVLNVLDMMLCLNGASHASTPGARGAGIVACMVKTTLKLSKLLVSTPAAIGPGLVLDIMGDCSGSMLGTVLKNAAK